MPWVCHEQPQDAFAANTLADETINLAGSSVTGKRQEQIQIIATVIGRPTHTAPPRMI